MFDVHEMEFLLLLKIVKQMLTYVDHNRVHDYLIFVNKICVCK